MIYIHKTNRWQADEMNHYGFWVHDFESACMEVIVLSTILDKITLQPGHKRLIESLLEDAKKRVQELENPN